jgi:Flp pilus assembly pilin Flp
MGGVEAVTLIAALVAVLGGISGIFAALLGHLLDED